MRAYRGAVVMAWMAGSSPAMTARVGTDTTWPPGGSLP
jgi:hypothetical protein